MFQSSVTRPSQFSISKTELVKVQLDRPIKTANDRTQNRSNQGRNVVEMINKMLACHTSFWCNSVRSLICSSSRSTRKRSSCSAAPKNDTSCCKFCYEKKQTDTTHPKVIIDTSNRFSENYLKFPRVSWRSTELPLPFNWALRIKWVIMSHSELNPHRVCGGFAGSG